MNAKEVFEKEWAMYGEWGTGNREWETGNGEWRTGRSNDGTDSFDGGIKPGEIRIFADMERPFVALIVESKGLAGWTIVPISPFTVPASSRDKALCRHAAGASIPFRRPISPTSKRRWRRWKPDASSPGRGPSQNMSASSS